MQKLCAAKKNLSNNNTSIIAKTKKYDSSAPPKNAQNMTFLFLIAIYRLNISSLVRSLPRNCNSTHRNPTQILKTCSEPLPLFLHRYILIHLKCVALDNKYKKLSENAITTQCTTPQSSTILIKLDLQ